jgi:putative RecB family exonuclease
VVRKETPVDEYRQNGERSLSHYYRRNYPFDVDETLGVEERVSFDLDDEGRYRIVGIVDRISRTRDGAIEIHDYKTGRWVPDQKELDRDRQLALYQIGVTEKFGDADPVRLVWHYLLRNQVRTSTRTPDQLASLRAETAKLIDHIRGEVRFDPKPSPLCSWCEYDDICPAAAGADASSGGEASTGTERRKSDQLSLI